MTEPANNEKDNALAAEYVLGLLSAEELEAFVRRLRMEPDLQLACDYWHEHFAGLTNTIDPVDPPARIKKGIESQLFSDGETAGNDTPGSLRPTGFWNNISKQWFAGAAAVVVMSLSVWLANLPDFDPQYTAQLQTEDQGMAVTALYDLEQGKLQIQPVRQRPPENGDYELWVIVGDAAPVSLGVMELADTQEITVPGNLVSAMATATLAISDEPAGGSPTGAPTGPVVAASPVQAI